jgi:hypothetical protein
MPNGIIAKRQVRGGRGPKPPWPLRLLPSLSIMRLSCARPACSAVSVRRHGAAGPQ